MTGRPQVANLCNDFLYTNLNKSNKCNKLIHHEQTPTFQNKFSSDVSNLIQTFKQIGNPFLEAQADLLVLDLRRIVYQSVIATVKRIEELDLKLYQTFMKERIIDQSQSIQKPIKRKKLPLSVVLQ